MDAIRYLFKWALVCLLALGGSLSLLAAVLPADRADALYHSYDGGGVEITGPSILVRKLFGNNTSLFGNYYVDAISSASIDVITSASPYKERREEKTLGVDYLHDKTTLSLAMTNSVEKDFTANSAHFTVSQDMFGDLTTVTMGFSRGWDEVGETGNANFSEDVRRQNYRLNLSQILTKNTVLDLGIETITDEGFLNNPYRNVRYIDLTTPKGYSYEAEVYPRTRTSNAVAIRGMYYLPYRAALSGSYRYYSDTWDIRANTYEIAYTHPFKKDWTFDVKLRRYDQTHADFYADLFPFAGAQNYLARDKELSTFSTNTVGVGVSYEFTNQGWKIIDKGSLNLKYDHISFDYDNFRDLRKVTGVAGEEPLYSFSADVLQLYLSIWY